MFGFWVHCIPDFELQENSKNWRKILHYCSTKLKTLGSHSFIRVVFESFQFLLLSNLSNLISFETSDLPNIVSLIFSIISISFLSFFVYLSYYVYKKKNGISQTNRRKLGEFLNEIKADDKPKLYSFFGLLRRTLLIVWLLSFKSLGPQALAIGFCLISFPYFIFILVVRPFEKVSNNVVEIWNEIFLFMVSLWICYFYKEGRWTNNLTKVFISIVLANTGVIMVVVSGNFLT